MKSVCVVVAMLFIGCGQPQLKKEEAQKLLESRYKGFLGGAVCSYTGGGQERPDKIWTWMLDREKCESPLKYYGVISKIETSDTPGRLILTAGNKATITCTAPMACKIEVECGEARFSVDSIVTEGRKATISYTVERVGPLEPAGCTMKVTGMYTDHHVVQAMFNDDGHWQLPR